jgi:hypothetical protein
MKMKFEHPALFFAVANRLRPPQLQLFRGRFMAATGNKGGRLSAFAAEKPRERISRGPGGNGDP